VLSRAIVPPQELSPRGAMCTSRSSKATSTGSKWPAVLSKYRDFFS
jgi:hypothetical protein